MLRQACSLQACFTSYVQSNCFYAGCRVYVFVANYTTYPPAVNMQKHNIMHKADSSVGSMLYTLHVRNTIPGVKLRAKMHVPRLLQLHFTPLYATQVSVHPPSAAVNVKRIYCISGTRRKVYDGKWLSNQPRPRSTIYPPGVNPRLIGSEFRGFGV